MAEAPASGAHVADYTFRVLKQDAAELKVTSFTGTEGVSELFHFRVELCADEPALDLEAYLAQPCLLELFGDYGSRYVNGIVRRFERTGEGSSLTYYAAEVTPLHWQLTRRFNCRIFHEETCPDMTIPGIIQKVFADAGVPDDSFDLTRLDLGQYKTREYVVQYRVSDHDFISQLCEEEGIFYFFEHTPEGHVMVFGDTSAAHRLLGQTAAGGPSQQASQGSQGSQGAGGNGDDMKPYLLPYRDPNSLVQEREFVFSVAARNSVEIGAVTLDDHNFTRPEVDLQTPEAKSDRFTALNVYDYPGIYPDENEGKRKVAIRLREQQCQRAVMQMKATARHLTPGYRFTLDEHPLPTLGLDYLITHVSHRATQPQAAEEQQLSDEGARYEAHFRVIPFAVPFCPPRVTPLPRVLGCQTAQVVKQKGSDNEIYCDKFGRVKVQFYWDHEQPPEDSSMMIRVSQGWAGAGWGQMFLPRVGQEVIVDYLEGNPNLPIIVGRVYNGTHMPPYKLPDEQTKSTIKTNSTENSKRFHEIRFEDKNKKEQLFIRAQRRMDTRVLGTHYHTAGGSLHEHLGGEDEEGNKKGRYFRTTFEGEDRHNKGDNYILIDDIRQTRVEKDVLDAFMANYALFVGDKIEMNAKTHVIEMKTSIALKVGGNFILIDQKGVTIVGATVKINSGGSAPTVKSQEGLKPLDAIPADTGKPGKRGGGGKPRTREPYTLEPQKAPPPPKRPVPPVPPPGPVVPPDLKCAILKITAQCEHKESGARIITANMKLEVVPSKTIGRDRIDLAAEVQQLCGPKHPEWSITNESNRPGLATNFQASPPAVSTLIPWIPKAQPKKYHVTARCCNGPSQSLDVLSYPNVELDVTLDLKKTAKWLYTIIKGIEWVVEIAAEKFSWKIAEGKGSVTAVWKEHTDWRAYYNYKIAAKFDPLIGIEAKISVGSAWITGKIKKIPWLGRYVQKVIDWLVKAGVYLKLTGGLTCDISIERSSPDQPLFPTTVGGGVGGKIGVALGVEGNLIGKKVIAVELEAGGAIVGSGPPFVDDRGFGIKKFNVDFDGLKGTLKFKLFDGWIEHSDTWTFIDKKNIWGPKKVYFYPPSIS